MTLQLVRDGLSEVDTDIITEEDSNRITQVRFFGNSREASICTFIRLKIFHLLPQK